GPYRAFTILEECKNNLSGKLWILTELAVFPTCESLIGADPKCPVARCQQVRNDAVGETLIRWRLPGDILDAIEADHSEFCAKPEITVRRLGNGVDGS